MFCLICDSQFPLPEYNHRMILSSCSSYTCSSCISVTVSGHSGLAWAARKQKDVEDNDQFVYLDPNCRRGGGGKNPNKFIYGPNNWQLYFWHVYMYSKSSWILIPGGPPPQKKKKRNIDFSGLCSHQHLSFFTLLDRASFLYYNKTKIIKFGW